MPLCVCLLFLSVLCVRFLCMVVCSYWSFILVAVSYSTVWFYHTWLIYSTVDRGLESFHFCPLQIVLLWTFWYIYFGEHLHAFLLGVCPGVHFWGHKSHMFFSRSRRWVPSSCPAVTPVSSPAQRTEESACFLSLPALGIFFLEVFLLEKNPYWILSPSELIPSLINKKGGKEPYLAKYPLMLRHWDPPGSHILVVLWAGASTVALFYVGGS